MTYEYTADTVILSDQTQTTLVPNRLLVFVQKCIKGGGYNLKVHTRYASYAHLTHNSSLPSAPLVTN